MRLLPDTHTVIWFADGSSSLGSAAAGAIEDPENEVLISAVVAWEIAIKRGLGKLQFSNDYLRVFLAGGGHELAVTVAHAAAVEYLPQHHQDPFDRLLIAQANAERAILVTDDEKIRRYDVETLW